MCGMGRRRFLRQTETNETRNSNRKVQSNMFLSTAFAFRVSSVPVAALGGHFFDALAPFVANEFSCAAQPNHNHINLLRENVIVIRLFCKAGQPSYIMTGVPLVCVRA